MSFSISSTRASRSAFGCAGDLEAEADVVGDVHVGEQRIGLEHHADLALVRVEVGDVACRRR